MAANMIESRPTANTGEGKSDVGSLTCLEPLLQANNRNLSQKQKDVLKHIVEHYEQEISQSGNDDHEIVPFDLSNRQRIHSDSHSNYNNFGINWYQLMLTTFIVCISSFIFGYVTVEASLIIDPSSPINIGALNYNYKLSQFEKQSLIPSCSLIGASIGSISLLFYPSIKYKRKTVLMLSNIPIIFGCILCISAVSPLMVIFGLIFEGFGFGISSVVAPVILAEIAPTQIRQFITIFHQLFITFGILTAALVTLPLIKMHHGWRYIVSIVIVVSGLQLILYKYIPESPRWLIANGKYEQAKKIITKFYKTANEAEYEYDYIYGYITSNDHVTNDDFRTITNWKWPLMIGIILNIFDQWTGINVIMYRSQDALKEQRINDNIFVAIIIIYLINFISTIICIICVKRHDISNKTLLYIGTCLMLLSSLFLGLINTTYHGDQSLVNQLSISQLPLYVFGFAISLGTFKWVIITESFPLGHRVRFASICVFVQWSCNAALSLSVDKLIIALDPNKTDDNYYDGAANLYFIFCVTITLCIIFINKYIPKTKGESLENSVTMYNRNAFAN